MKKLSAAIGVALIFGAVAYTPSVKADPCSALLCMAGEPNVAPGCAGYVAEFFSIQIWGIHGFKPVATSIAREQFLNACPGAAANAAVVARVIATYGSRLYAP